MQRRPSLTEGKLMIMRVLKALQPLDENQLAEFFVESELLTYFEIKEALTELQASKLIAASVRGSSLPDTYLLTNKGQSTYDMFSHTLPLPMRDRVDALVPKWKQTFSRREQIRTRCFCAGENDYCANLKIYEHSVLTMELSLHLPDLAQAQQVAKAFEKNAALIYSNIWNDVSGKNGN